jgi:enamine deaminase RidA (YjgF/YER057c/UK114 family)
VRLQRFEVGTDHGLQPGRPLRQSDRRHRLRRDQRRRHHAKSFGEQTARSLAIIQAAIEALGGTMGHVIRTRMYVTDVSKWEEVARVHGSVFADIRPATTIVEVARLIDGDAVIEIEADAVIPEAPRSLS